MIFIAIMLMALCINGSDICRGCTDVAFNIHRAGGTGVVKRECNEAIKDECMNLYVIEPRYSYVPISDQKTQVTIHCEDWELEQLVRVIYLEAGAESDICIRCCTDVAFNQLQSGLFGDTLYEVLYYPRNYDETVWRIWDIEPSERVREIVMDVYENGISIPQRIMYYRNQYYHDIWWSIPEFTVDNVFFSSSRWYQ